jgi:molecular chaperone DnaK
VKAKDLGTGKSNSITITGSSNLTQEEIDKMVKEAEEYAEADKEAKQFILDKNELEMLCSNMKTTCEEQKDKQDSSLIDPVLEAITVAEEALKENDKVKIADAKSKLLTASHALSSKLYEQTQSVSPDDAVEAEVVNEQN